jgi:hypothetical protein
MTIEVRAAKLSDFYNFAKSLNQTYHHDAGSR